MLHPSCSALLVMGTVEAAITSNRSGPQEIAHDLGDLVGLLELRGMSATIHGLQSGPGEAPHEFVGVDGRHEPVVLTPEE